MALQVRRGTNAERVTITPAEGELIYTTDTKVLYVGDGVTPGGTATVANTINSLLEDTTPQLGGTLDLNGNDITGIGNINVTGNITATGNINLGDQVGDIINIAGTISGPLLPDMDKEYNIGSPTSYWNDAFIGQLTVDSQITAERINANIIADDSTVVFDASTGTVAGSAITGDISANLISDPVGIDIFASNGTNRILLSGTDGTDARLQGNVTANTGSSTFNDVTINGTLTASLTGNVNGSLDGDVSGSLFANDSTLIIDAISATGVLKSLAVDTITPNFQAGVTVENADVNLARDADVPRMLLRRDETGALSEASSCGRIIWAKTENGVQTTVATMSVAEQQWNVVPSPGGTPDYTKTLRFHREGKLGINGTITAEPDANLHVTGTSKLDGAVEVAGTTGSLLLGRLTTAERDALTAVNGMIIYNSSVDKFQGYENGIWANLI